MDPFDEFEFKPLTDGLGFQRKSRAGTESDNENVNVSDKSSARASSDPQTSTKSKSSVETVGAEISRGDLSKRPTHSRNITEIISSLPSLDLFDEQDNERTGRIIAAVSTRTERARPEASSKKGPAPLSEAKSAKSSGAKLEKPFGGKLSAGPGVATTSASGPGASLSTGAAGRGSFAAPRPGSPTVPDVAAMAQMAKAASLDVLGGDIHTTPTSLAPTPKSKTSRATAAATTMSLPNIAGKGMKISTASETLRPETRPVTFTEVAATTDLVALILDGVMIVGLALLFLVGLLVATKVNLMVVLANLRTDLMTQVAAALLLFSVQQLYLILSRSFYGCTLGEWAFDLCVGTSEQQKSPSYPLRVAWRSLFLLLSGGMILPLLSIIFRSDIVRFVGGLAIHRREMD